MYFLVGAKGAQNVGVLVVKIESSNQVEGVQLSKGRTRRERDS